MRVDVGMDARSKAGRSCWASGRLAMVDSMRGAACLRRPGRMMEAIAVVVACAGRRRRGGLETGVECDNRTSTVKAIWRQCLG
jgi:hypothetical protein